MKGIYTLLLSVTVSVIIISCDKIYERDDGLLVINDYEEVDIQAHDTLIAGHYYDQVVYEIDMDHDGVNDIAFWSVITGSPGMGMIPQAGLMALHDGALLYEQAFKDSIYLHTTVDTFYYDRVEIYTTHTSTCGKKNQEDSLLRVEDNTFITLMKQGQIGSLSSAIWKADSLALRTSSYSSRQHLEMDSPDTLKIRREVVNECHYMISNEIYYTGYQNGFGKLGWIKFSVDDGFRISVIETAIEK